MIEVYLTNYILYLYAQQGGAMTQNLFLLHTPLMLSNIVDTK